MPKIKLVLEYDGTDFFGFQIQKNHRTVQEVLEKTLSRILQKPIRVVASGRTDSGVHAEGQVVHFTTASTLSTKRLLSALHGELPHDIGVLSIARVKEDFHARFSVRSKTYCYQVWNSRQRAPLKRRFVYQVFDPLDIGKMKKAARYFVGRHDFASFQASRFSQKGGTVRTILKFKIETKGPLVRFWVQADGFLYNMVRNLVGTLIEVGKGRLRAEQIPNILKRRDRRLAGPTAPPQGLSLIKVYY